MNPDWTFLAQPDDPEPDVNHETTCSRFFEERNVLDATFWEELPLPSIESYPDSHNVPGLGASWNTNLGCACNFPPLYCEQHGAYGDASAGNDLSLPSFNLEQAIASPNDVQKSSGLVPGRLELTPESLNGQSLFPDPFETGHANPGTSTNYRSDSAHPCPDFQLSSKLPQQQRLRRSKISSKDRCLLQAHFSKNPYPKDVELDELHKRTGLATKCIKTWFNNTRHRSASRRMLPFLFLFPEYVWGVIGTHDAMTHIYC